eukprot:351879-Chlamydomonas_euryale.AAC.22
MGRLPACHHLHHNLSSRHPRVADHTAAQPPCMAPPKAFVRRVWIERRVTVQMVVAVGADPLDWVTLGCKHSTVRQCVLEPLWRGEGAVA